MSDTSGHDATRRDLHTINIRGLEALVNQAGIVMSRRQLIRHCKSGTFDAIKLPAANNVEEWFVAPASVEKGIADIKVLQEHRARRDASVHDMTDHETSAIPKQANTDMSGRDVTGQDTSAGQRSDEISPTGSDVSRHDAPPDTGIYEHPYVKRLEAQVDKWEGKYLEQVRRTEDIQRDHRKELIELQRMTGRDRFGLVS
jgi:hypothetical protein